MGLALLIGAVMLFGQEVPGGNPIVQPPINVTSTTVVQVPPMDPQAVSDASIIADQSFIVNVVQPVPVSWTNALCDLPDLWRTTPANLTFEQPQVHDLSLKIMAGALSLLGLAILAQGLGHAMGQELQLGRVALGVVLSIGTLSWWQIGVGMNNALTSMIAAPDPCASLIKPHIVLQNPPPTSVADGVAAAIGGPVLVIVYALVSLMVLPSLLFRLGLLDVLICAGPLALMCFSSEQSEHIGQWYVRLAVGTLFGQVLLVMGLQVASVLSGIGSGLAGTILGLVVLLLCRSLLGTLSSQNIQRGGVATGAALALALRRLVAKV